MIDTNYAVEALELLLCKDCLTERYYPLIPYKDALIKGLLLLGCRTKNEAAMLSDDEFKELGLAAPELIGLLRRFFTIYDPKPQKFWEIPWVTDDPYRQSILRELFLLPGVKLIRADLYYRSGYRSLEDFAKAAPQEILEKTADTIREQDLPCSRPLPKEVRTHIAVAKAFLFPKSR